MSVADNLAKVRELIAEAERRAGRECGSVRLMAVSKFHPASAVLEAARAGQTLFGENRVQEATEKFDEARKTIPGLELHIIGSLQRNKAAKAVSIASCVQSVDRLELLESIAGHAEKIDKTVDILFECHTGEESKSGYADDDALFRSIDALESLPTVRCRGLMTMAPFTRDEAIVRASFKRLSSIRDECARRWPAMDFSTLSMGMSGDFGIAIEEGSTLVRIGTAIFGERQ
jgi:PLP dependent protein